jgi:hypothetical protein
MTDPMPVYPLPRRDEHLGVAAVDEGDSEKDSREKEQETCHDKQVVFHEPDLTGESDL